MLRDFGEKITYEDNATIVTVFRVPNLSRTGINRGEQIADLGTVLSALRLQVR